MNLNENKFQIKEDAGVRAGLETREQALKSLKV
jgi:hypothetical protein